MYMVVMNEELKNILLQQDYYSLIKEKNTINNKSFWVFEAPGVFNYNFDEKFKGEYFLTEHIRFDF